MAVAAARSQLAAGAPRARAPRGARAAGGRCRRARCAALDVDASTVLQGVPALAIVFAARGLALGAGKKMLDMKMQENLAACEERGIDISDMYADEETYGEAYRNRPWFLVGPWTPIKPGEPKFEPTKFNGVLRQCVKIHDARIEAKELGVDLSDVTEETYGIKQWQEIYKRMEAGRKAAGKA